MVKFNHGYVNDYGRYLRQLIEEAKHNHSSLSDVRTFDPGEVTDAEVLKRGWPGWTLKAYETNSEHGAVRLVDPNAIGGTSVTMTDPRGGEHRLILLRVPKKCLRPWLDMVNVGVFFHELGHTDDWERQINFHGDTIDQKASEIYAHTFACREMRQRGFKEPLGFYIGECLECALKLPNLNAVAAAQEFRQSEEWQLCEAFAPSEIAKWRAGTKS